MNLAHLCKNKVFLIILFIVLTAVFSYGILYTKGKKDREKESNTDKFKRAVLPAFLVSSVIVGGLYFFKGRNPADVMLEGDFHDKEM
jgi:uncharacterized membrane protein